MGFWNKLRSPRPTMDVTVHPARVRPGDDVTITVVVSGEIGTKYERFEFGLIGGGTWMATANVPGSNIHTQQAFNWHKDLRDLPMATGTTSATFTVPADAPGTCTSPSAHLMTWNALARGEGGRYLNEVAELTVEVVPDAYEARERLPAVDHDPSDAVAVRLDVLRRVAAGGTVTGEVVVTGKAGGTIEELALETQAWRVTADDDRLDHDPSTPFEAQGAGVFDALVEKVRVTVPDAPGTRVEPGGEHRFPVSIPLPTSTFTTIATPRVRSHVRITARVVLEHGGKPWTAVELNVPTAPA